MPVRSKTVTQTFRQRTLVTSSWGGWQTIPWSEVEESRPSINHFPLNTSTDDGGPWFLSRVIERPSFGSFDGVSGKLTFDGQLLVAKRPADNYSYGQPTIATDAELDVSGTAAMARVAPVNPAFNASVALGELMSDGVPAIAGHNLARMREATALARSAGKDYLNVSFGWLPLLSDVRALAKAVKASGEILHQYRRDSGMKIRRSYEFPTVDVSNTRAMTMSTVPAYATGPGFMSERTSTKKWFRGAFKYHIPTSDTQLGKFQQWISMSDHLLGWKVTPETLWNIAPWSWATDWFANTGDVITNITNLGKDGLVMQYGYSMKHSFTEVRMDATYTARYDQKTSSSRYILTEYKQRRPATPYGFGVDEAKLSARQIAIIAALGLSKT
jgi:hypothetical protein